MDNLLGTALYLLALVNPVSKVFVLATLSKSVTPRELRALSLSSLIGLAILLAFAVAGNMILKQFFHVEIYSFQIVGGAVLFYVGFKALNKGVFFEVEEGKSISEISIVPLASPMIAGPATITAAVSFTAQYGLEVTVVAIVLAVACNLAIMLASQRIGRFLTHSHLMGALIRITGLVVATIAVQMVLDGLKAWWRFARV